MLMLYSSFNHRADPAVIWQYGPSAQATVVGSTAGDPQPGSKFIPLSFDELAHDLVVAAYFSPILFIYNLEACVRRGLLPRLIAPDWGQPVTVSADANRQVVQFRAHIQSSLWTLDRLPYFALAILFADSSSAVAETDRFDANCRPRKAGDLLTNRGHSAETGSESAWLAPHGTSDNAT